MNLGTLKDAIQAWFATATGLSSVVWEDQGGPRPAYPYGTLSIQGIARNGRDEHRYEYDEDLPAGANLLDLVAGNRPFELHCQVLNASTGDSGLEHNSTAMSYMIMALSSLSDANTLDTLSSGGASFLRSENALDISEQVNGRWVSRASLDLHMLAVDNQSMDPGSYINRTLVSGEFEHATGSSLDFEDEQFGDQS